ncbi:MAG: hypothetical protein C5B52_06340 [Bacteroidetes bacterium]|nr:MAG: hypothetical protein C5B52_06340 [Bacteroidota bacterium]
MIFKTVIPILFSENVRRSLDYYVDVLEFARKWDWGSPPSFGGVVKDSVEIFFSENAQGNKGTWISIMIDDVDTYFQKISARGAKILVPPETKEWGVREMLVCDPDDHVIRFGSEASIQDREIKSGTLPDEIRIVQRSPNHSELNKLEIAMGWEPSDERNPQQNSTHIFSVVAENPNGEVVGCASLLGDNKNFFYVHNVWVDPRWQNKHIGSALMKALSDWLDQNALPNSSAWLHTNENLAPFYKQFGFSPVFGMYRQIK